ncbi:MAG: hypothetical protein IPH97_07880 [Ignavibacteriales bacterium]|nr:hypothetical protein [Ignavibacteriales bacterium]
MKIVFFVCLLFIPLLLSCSNCKETSLNKEITTTQDQKNPTSIVQNISIVTARIESIVFNSDTDYKIKATVLTVEEKSDKPSIAVPGNEYLLQPKFYYDNNELVVNDVNESLKKLSKMEKGKTFKAEISLENQKGWFIQKVLSE